LNPASAGQPPVRPTREQAIAAAREIASGIWAEMNATAAKGGARAVAEAGFEAGGPSLEELEATWNRWQAEEREKWATGSAVWESAPQ